MRELVREHRGRLFGLAYRMLGSVTEAEDAVQEAFARLAAADDVEDPAGWLTTVVAHLCVDRLRSAQRRRETYVGPWLPEPLLTDERDPSELAETADSLTLAFLTVLERLSPSERVVFLLHDVFGYPHQQIATMLGRPDTAVRKLASRARTRLGEDLPRYEQDAARRHEVAEAFIDATQGGDLVRLVQLLSPDVVFTSDGGGAVSAARWPLRGAEPVARFLVGIAEQATAGGWTIEPVEINGGPGVLATHQGTLETVMALHVLDGHIEAIHAVRNPQKLETIRGQAGRSWTPVQLPRS